MDFDYDLSQCLQSLRNNGSIAFPSPTGWQLACDAMDELAVDRLKGKSISSSISIFIASNRDLLKYVAAPDPAVFDFLDSIDRPTTIVFENGLGLANNALNDDGSVSIRVVQDDFSKHLIKRFGKPLAVADLAYADNSIHPNSNQIDPTWYNLCDYIAENLEGRLPLKTANWVKWNDGPTPIAVRP